ncbi:MAG: glycogen synthase [Candidatus Ancillula sp.]|nr:glycogen synthase [Candidatus Ancillula sp.]
MKVDLLTREYPPKVYGGAGVHVEELSKVLREDLGENNVEVRCFDGFRDASNVYGYDVPKELQKTQTHNVNPALSTFGVDLQIANDCAGADLVHSHTWYANLAGFLASELYSIPHVITAHSLEPLRPWKAEQLGGGYNLSSFAEKTAYENAAGIIAVSGGMRNDILRCYPNVDPEKVFVVHNGIDLDSFKLTGEPTDVLDRYGIDTNKPTAVFVGRITRQKGLVYFLQAVQKFSKDIQIVLCAGMPDTKEIEEEVSSAVEKLKETRGNIIWIDEMLPKHELTTVLNSADVFICPSIYEPLGIVNLEAMALKLPVVATATGGIPEVVVDGETGYLVPIEQVQDGTGTPLDPDKFTSDFAAAVDKMFSDLDRAKEMGEAGYKRAQDNFSWKSISKKTIEVYKKVLG